MTIKRLIWLVLLLALFIWVGVPYHLCKMKANGWEVLVCLLCFDIHLVLVIVMGGILHGNREP